MTEPTGYNPALDDSEEIWKPIPETDGWYDASTHGRIRSWKKHRGHGRRIEPYILKGDVINAGYVVVDLYLPHSGRKKMLVHAVIAEIFHGARPDGCNINHINGCKTDNRSTNLEYITQSENIRHARDRLNGLARQKLVYQQVEEIIAHLLEAKLNQKQIGKMYQVSGDTIKNIWVGKSWVDLPRPYPVGKYTYNQWRKIQHEKGNTT